MGGKVSIVMYHYVRELARSRYPGIKGLDIREFRHQLDYLGKHYRFISMDIMIEAIEGRTSLPEKAVLLTFDDAYIDHFLEVYPLLNERGIPAAFYPPARAVHEHVVLDVNKIHYILAAQPDTSQTVAMIKGLLANHRLEHELESDEWYYRKLAVPGRYDSPEVVFIKRLLQRELPEPVRGLVLNQLFEEIVGVEESTLSRELYMSKDQLRCLLRAGMHLGNHGYDHHWLDRMDPEAQREDIGKAVDFLVSLGVPRDRWTMCYPYGSYNEKLQDLLGGIGCRLALTTEVGIAEVNTHKRFALPRLNTNDIPKAAGASVNAWYELG